MPSFTRPSTRSDHESARSRRPLRAVTVAAVLLALLGSGLPAAAAAQTPPPVTVDVPPSTPAGATEAPADLPADPADAVDPADPADPGAGTVAPGAPAEDTAPAPAARSAAPLAAADLPRSQVKVVKTTDLDGAPLTPGTEFLYLLTVQCSGLTVDCVNQTLTDVLPEGLDVTSVPQSTPARTVTYDEESRLLTVVFHGSLQEPVGTRGLGAGSTVNLELGVRLPAESQLLDGTVLTNTAEVVADNAPVFRDSADVTISVPRAVTPVATKSWTGPAAIAGIASASTILLGVRNGSSSTAQVTELSITEDGVETFDSFDLTGVELVALPAGATSASLTVTVDGVEHAADALTAPGAFALPAGVSAADVTGVRVVFTGADGAVLPYDATGGSVRLGMVLRDTLRSTGAPLRPTERFEVPNCVVPGAVDTVLGGVDGTPACAGTEVLPDTLVLTAVKRFVPTTATSFTGSAADHAVLGHRSWVTASVDVTNSSPFPVAEIVVSEPYANPGDAPQSASEFEKLDAETVRLRLPAGATDAHLVVTYDDGSVLDEHHAESGTVELAPGTRKVVSVVVTYTGRDADGHPSIARSAVAGLDVRGRLNDLVTEDDLPDGTSPGIANCAGFSGSAGRTDSTGTTAGTACQALAVEQPRTSGVGTKTVGQVSVPFGQPIPFSLTMVNRGNVSLVSPVMTDPATTADGTPSATGNPFTTLQITGVTARTTATAPPVTIEVYDPVAPAGWVAYAGVSTDVLARATGVRARVEGELRPTHQVVVDVTTVRRAGTPDGTVLSNCFTTTVDGALVGEPACSQSMTTGPAADSGVINKSISPATLPRHVPGLPRQVATMTLTALNSGNMSMRTLQLLDTDAEFFDAVDLTGLGAVTFPAGADRIQVDVLSDGRWVDGTPSTTAALPAGVDAATVTGLRATFTSTSTVNDGFTIRPCASSSCQGRLVVQISPRPTLRSDATQTVPDGLSNTASGSYTSSINPDPAHPRAIEPIDATLQLVDGSARLAVTKTDNAAIAPGETTHFDLTVVNTGTAPVSNLVVTDPLPAGLALDETFVGDDDQPFTLLSSEVPAGTPPVPAPVFTTTTDGERTSALTWDFSTAADGEPWVLAPGARLTVRFYVTLEPGVVTDQRITNVMGATGTGPSLTCAGPSVTDGVFGAGTYCTASAAVTTKGGAAFTARKWVSGTDALGWFSTRTHEALPVGSPQCPSRVGPDGATYTAYPCIALVEPGDELRYLLRLVNAGTEPATHMRVVDRFPVEGDTGVVLDLARGTEWGSRPTLASEPVLTGPGTMTTSYTTGSDICTADLAMGGAGSDAARCADGDWADPFGPDVTAARMELEFPTPLAPGGSVDLTFTMSTPLDVEEVSAPTIAWNSFAHAETTDRNGRARVLPPTEPIQVGVGMLFGSLQVRKAIGDNPFGLALDDVTFPVTVACTAGPAGARTVVLSRTIDVSVDAPVTIDRIPSGADCTVTEVDPRGGRSSSPTDAPDVVRIVGTFGGVGEPRAVQPTVVVNDFPVTTLRVVKDVSGDAAASAPDSFEVEVTCTVDGTVVTGFPVSVAVSPGIPTDVDVPAGALCGVVETGTGGATQVTYGEDHDDASTPVLVVADEVTEALVHNEFRAGSLVVSKELAGPGAPVMTDGPFEFSVVCSLDGREGVVSETVVVTGDGTLALTSAPLTGLPVGAECVVAETGTGGADSTPAPVTVTVPDAVDGVAQTVVAGFTNVFSAATLDLTKRLDGDAATSPLATEGVFTVLVTCQRDDVTGARVTVHASSVQVRGGETVRLTAADGSDVLLPLGTRCYAEETDTGGATAVTIEASSFETGVAVGTAEEVSELGITVVNTFTAPPADDVPPTDPSAPPVADGHLPQTGAEIGGVATLAVLLLLAGLVVVVVRRRHARHG